jgi:hypothetical protein
LVVGEKCFWKLASSLPQWTRSFFIGKINSGGGGDKPLLGLRNGGPFSRFCPCQQDSVWLLLATPNWMWLKGQAEGLFVYTWTFLHVVTPWDTRNILHFLFVWP